MQTELFQDSNSDSYIWEISEINSAIRKKLETSFARIWIRGEISNLKSYSSGHHYFQLKDSNSQLKAVLFKSDAKVIEKPLQEGSKYLIFGDITVYEPRGDYQVRVKHLMEEGIGNLRMEFDRLKHNLLKEGLFNVENKKPLPKLPLRIGLITSPDGAAIEDFISVLERKGFKGEIVLSPSLVQGLTAPTNLQSSLDKLTDLDKQVDVIVLTRGGGSLEDLWAFNDESLVRKVFACSVPIISAVGHQTDFVLTDFAADLRAETPTAAAEIISSSFLEQIEILKRYSSDLRDISDRFLMKLREKLEILSMQIKIASPEHRIQVGQQSLDDLGQRLQTFTQRFFEKQRGELEFLETRLNNANIDKVLRKGFAVIKDRQGKIISSVKTLQKANQILVSLKDGEQNLKVSKG